MKILILEDNEFLRDVMKLLMDKFGYFSDIVVNGKEAAELAVNNVGQYDLGIFDIDMPVLSGTDAAFLIRKTTKYFPILGVSGNPENRTACIKVGMDSFLEKPFNMRKLYEIMNDLTLKVLAIRKRESKIVVAKEMPVSPEELKELIELDKKGLAKFCLIDANYKFIVHKNLQNKISYDFIAKGKRISEFLDRNQENPGIIHLYAENMMANKRYILPEKLNELMQIENAEFDSYNIKHEYPDRE